MSLKDLLKLPKEEVEKFLNSFDTVLSDCDGVLWLENNPIPGSSNVLNRLREMGKKVFYVTNNSTKTRAQYVEKCRQIDFIAEEDEIMSTAYLAAMYLKDNGFSKKLYLVGNPGIGSELDQVGIAHFGIGPDHGSDVLIEMIRNAKLEDGVGGVLVGFDPHLSYPKMLKAANYLLDPDCLYLATNLDDRFPVNKQLVVPGTGAIVQSITVAAGREPIVLGKPSLYLSVLIQKQYGIDPKRTLMIGDRMNTDIVFGKKCGYQTMLVGTGVSTWDDALGFKNSSKPDDHLMVPDVYLNCLGDLEQFLY